MRKKPAILMVDNDPDYLDTIHDRLEQAGYQVYTAMDESSALGAVEANDPDMIVVDVRLSDEHDTRDRSGLKLLRKLPADLPSIVLTAYEDARAVRDAFEAIPGANRPKAFLFKGDGAEALLANIQLLLQNASPSAKPWYRERGFIIQALVTMGLLAGGIYIFISSNGNSLVGVILVGVVVELLAAIIVRLLHI
ncbi:MAG: response regulator [Chloroflexi bacterium]|nr:response regulator [Chloroflexota bacterium]